MSDIAALANRVSLIERSISDIMTAMNNLATNNQFYQLSKLYEARLSALEQEVEDLKTQIEIIRNEPL